MMPYLFLIIAICAEIGATSFMKASKGFTRSIFLSIPISSYGVAFHFLTRCLRTILTGIAYAIWSGVGVGRRIVFVTGEAWFFQGQKLNIGAMVGMGLIIAGVAVMNMFSATVI